MTAAAPGVAMEVAVNVPTSVGSSEYTSLPFADAISWTAQRSFGTAIESLGFDGLAVPDHLMTGEGTGTTECLTTLAALARETEDVYLYPKTVNDLLRHGPLLAKIAATLDGVSEGRLKLGMGAGWKRDEAEAYGYEWPGAPDRLRAMEESIEIAVGLWTNDSFSYDGEYYSVDEATCTPHPVQEPYPPIMVGGGGEEFTLRIAAKHADCWNFWGSVDVMERKLSVLADHCETYDTDYDAIQSSWFARCVIRETEAEVEALLDRAPRFRPENLDETENHLVGTPAQVVAEIERYRDLGIEELVVEFVDFPETTGAELFADEVVPALR
jgi:alkanesulfonate monooxygenase SsuD/methylene tetrahydromethanopterin reductase-like flavin-dependent oxidoreductase (luciferase family)